MCLVDKFADVYTVCYINLKLKLVLDANFIIK